MLCNEIMGERHSGLWCIRIVTQSQMVNVDNCFHVVSSIADCTRTQIAVPPKPFYTYTQAQLVLLGRALHFQGVFLYQGK